MPLYIGNRTQDISYYDITFHHKARIARRQMLLISVAWLYVVLMVAVVEATSSTGTLLGAFFTVVLYGVMPVGIVAYLFLSPARRRARRAAEAADPGAPAASAADPDDGSHAAGDPVAPIRKEP